MISALNTVFIALFDMPILSYQDIISYIQSVPAGGGAYIHLLNPQLIISVGCYIGSALLIFSVFVFIPLRFLNKKWGARS